MDNSVETLVDLPQCFLYMWWFGFFFVMGGFEVCTLSRFGRYCMLHLQGGWIVVVDFLNIRAAPPICSSPPTNRIFHIQHLVIYFFFPSSIHRTELGDCKRQETTNSNPPILDESNHHEANQQQVLDCTVPLASQPASESKNSGPKPFCQAKTRHVLTFLHPKFVVVCNSGVALRNYIFLEPNVHCTCLQMTCHCCCCCVCTVLYQTFCEI